MVEEPKKVKKRIFRMLEDKVPVLEISKVSPDIIAAWKYPKLFKNTVHNQFMRCSKYYVPTTIESVLPLIKNPEHFSDLEQIKYKKSVCHELRVIKDEAQKFIGNVDLTKRTRGQQNQNCTSTKVSSTKPSSTVLRKRKLSIENKAPPAKKNVQASHNNPHFVLEDTDCINLCNPTSLSSDIEAEPVEAVPEITVPKKCKPSAKTVTFRPQLKTPNNHLDMPELTEFMNYQETDLTNLNCRPKLVLKIKNCLSEHYQAYSDVDEFSPARKIPESSKFVTQTIPPQITPSLSKEACRGKGIGSKDIEIMKPRRKKAAPKTNGNKIKPPVIKKAKTVKKVTTLQKVKPHLKKAEEFFIVSESSDSDIDPPTPKKVCNYVKSSGKTVKAQILHKPETKTSDREKRIRRKSMYADLFGKDSDDNVTSSNNEDSQNIRNRVIEKMNDKVNIHINGDMVDTINDIEEITNEFDNSDSSVIDEEINIRESNNTEADDSDVISLLADDDFNDDFACEETTTSAPKKDTSVTSINETKPWSAVLDDCRLTLRKDTDSTPNGVKPGNVTRNFNNNTKTIVNNMPKIPFLPNKQLTYMLKTVFSGLCVEFANESCMKTCKQRHEFPSVVDVRQNMSSVNLTTIETAYEFIKNHPKMFLMYFPVFCDIFGFFKLPNRLKAMFTDCERQSRTIDYYRHVVNALTKTGILKYKSIRMCIEVVTDSPYARETIINMIAETGPDVVRFVDYLTRCGTLPMPMFNKIMEQCVTYQNPDLQYYLLSSFQQALQHETVASQVNEVNMIKLLQLIKRSQEFNNEQINGNLLSVLEKVRSF